MKENIFLLIILTVTAIVITISALWDAMKSTNTTASELHASDRYAVAEQIEKELEEK